MELQLKEHWGKLVEDKIREVSRAKSFQAL